MRTRAVVLASVIIVVLAAMFAGMSLSAIAQSSTSTPGANVTPTVNGGNAKWTIKSRTFTSQYPHGFTFTIQASSTGGDLKSVRVYWRHGPVSQQSRPATYDPKKKTWTAVWEVTPGGGAVPAWVAVNYWFSLIDAQDNAYQTDVQHTEYADNTKPWGRAESDDIIVFWQKPLSDDVGQMVLDAMAKVREKYRTAWGRLLSYKPRAILYANLQSYAEWDASPTGAQHTLGITSASWGGTVQRNANDIQDLTYGTVPHEIDHLYQADLNMVAESWWIEGDATFFEMHQMYDYEEHARELAQEPNFPALRNGISTTGNHARDGYDIGYAFIKYLTDTYGLEIHKKILDNMVHGKALFDAIAAATDQPFDDVEYDFRVWLGVPDPTLPTALPTIEVQFPPTPTYETP